MRITSMDFEVLIEKLKTSRQKYLKNTFLASKDPYLKRLILKEMREWEIEDKELLEYSLEEKHFAVLIEILKYCHKLSIVLSEKVYEDCINSTNDKIRAALILYSEKIFPWLTTEELKDFLTDHSPKVRKAVVKRLKDHLDLEELHIIVEKDPSISVKNEALKLIVEKSNDSNEIIWVFQHPSSKKSTLKRALKKITILSRDYLFNLFKSEKRDDVKVLIIEALKDSPCHKVKETLLPYLEKKNEIGLIAKVIYSLSFSCKGDEEIFEKLKSFLDSESSLLRKEALKSLRRMSKERIDIRKVLEMLDDPDIDVLKEALNTLSLLGIKNIERQVAFFLSSKDENMKKTALVAIRRLKLREFEGTLLNLMNANEKLEIRKSALKALYAIKSQPLEGILRDIFLSPKVDFELKYLAAKMAAKSYPTLITQL